MKKTHDGMIYGIAYMPKTRNRCEFCEWIIREISWEGIFAKFRKLVKEREIRKKLFPLKGEFKNIWIHFRLLKYKRKHGEEFLFKVHELCSTI